jgi:hypothetical protein
LAPEVDARVEVSRSVQNARSLPVTDLSRSRLTEQKEIEASIFRVWLEALLVRIGDIEARPIGDPNISKELFLSANWLESYSAFDLFRLAKTAWPYRFRDASKTRTLFVDWEKGEGSSLWAGGTYSRDLSSAIFGMILPKITSIVVGDEGNYFARPPSVGWRDVLENWNTFVREGVSWPIFADYLPAVDRWLYDCYSGNNFLNKRFEEHFDGFELLEIQSFPSLLEKLVSARNSIRAVQFERSEISLLVRLSEVGGDLRIRRFGASHKVRDLITGKAEMSKTQVVTQ